MKAGVTIRTNVRLGKASRTRTMHVGKSSKTGKHVYKAVNSKTIQIQKGHYNTGKNNVLKDTQMFAKGRIYQREAGRSEGSFYFGSQSWRNAHGVLIRKYIEKLSPKLHSVIMEKLRAAQREIVKIMYDNAGWSGLTGNADESMGTGLYSTRRSITPDVVFMKSKHHATRGKLKKGHFVTAKEKKLGAHIVKVVGTKEYITIYDDAPWLMDTTGEKAYAEAKQMLELYKPDPALSRDSDKFDAYEFAVKSGVEYAERLRTLDGQYFMRYARKQARRIMEEKLSKIRFEHDLKINDKLTTRKR